MGPREIPLQGGAADAGSGHRHDRRLGPRALQDDDRLALGAGGVVVDEVEALEGAVGEDAARRRAHDVAHGPGPPADEAKVRQADVAQRHGPLDPPPGAQVHGGAHLRPPRGGGAGGGQEGDQEAGNGEDLHGGRGYHSGSRTIGGRGTALPSEEDRPCAASPSPASPWPPSPSPGWRSPPPPPPSPRTSTPSSPR